LGLPNGQKHISAQTSARVTSKGVSPRRNAATSPLTPAKAESLSSTVQAMSAPGAGRHHERGASHGTLRSHLVVTSIVIAAVALTTTTACGSSSPSQHVVTTGIANTTADATTGPAPPAATRRIDALLSGIPQSGAFLGSPTAPVTLQYFADVVCPASREITTGPLASIIRKWVRPGKLRIEFRSIEEGSEPSEVFVSQQVAALAAGMQDKLWFYLEYAYQDLEQLGSNFEDTCHPPTEDFAQIVARRVPGLSFARWSQDQHSQELANEVAADERATARLGVANPPHPIPRYPNPAYLIGFTAVNNAMTLTRFSRVAPSYDEVARELIAAKVVAG
jgi:hypothetical protein